MTLAAMRNLPVYVYGLVSFCLIWTCLTAAPTQSRSTPEWVERDRLPDLIRRHLLAC